MSGLGENPVVFVSGATGTGKSSLAVAIAQELRASGGYQDVVVINCDVMQFYRDLPIATNKACKEEVQGIPHTFIGFLNPDDTQHVPPEEDYYACDNELPSRGVERTIASQEGSFTIHTYVDRVTRFIDSFFNEHKHAAVVVCGGTCYYLQSLLLTDVLVTDDIDKASSASATETVKLSRGKAIEDADGTSLWGQLNAIDPVSAERYHPNDTRRIRRLLEIYEERGIPPSEIFQGQTARLRFSPGQTYLVWTWVERDLLNMTLRRRVDGMVTKGLLQEVRDFRDKVSGLSKVGIISDAIGYKEFKALSTDALSSFENPETKAAVEKVKNDTIQYARKQERWLANRIQDLLRMAKPPLSIDHFVQVRLDAENAKASAAGKVLQAFVASSASPMASVPDWIRFPLRSAEEAAKAPVTQEFCSVCAMVVYGRGQLEAHRNSKRHKGALKRQRLEQDQLEKFGRILPPRKNNRKDQ